jgi:hypothetical protein
VTDRTELQEEQDGLPDSHLFTVRLWPEALGPGRVEWRGKVTHVLSGEARFFREWQALLDFLVAERANAATTSVQQLLQ